MADLNIAGHKVSPAMAAVFAGGSGIAIWFAVKQHKASTSSPSASSIDPITGLPYSQDSQTDPLTGEAYLAEAQQYGSVSAAENAVAGESSLDYSTAYGTGSGLVGTSSGASLVPASEVQGTTYASNAAWAQAVEAGLTDIGYTSTDVAAALGRYLGGLSETSAQATIVQAAVAEYGTPPVGTFQIIQAPAAATSTTTTTASTSTAKKALAAPGGLKVTKKTSDGVSLAWNAVSGASGYTIATYNSKGSLVNQHTASATSTSEYGPSGSGLPKGSYHSNVWANGGSSSPPHSSVSFTLTK